MGVGVDAEGAAEGLEDHAEEVPIAKWDMAVAQSLFVICGILLSRHHIPRVEADERDQQQVEGVPHLVPAERRDVTLTLENAQIDSLMFKFIMNS